MAVESGSNVSLSYVAESTHGTTPGGPTMKLLRSTSRDINPSKGSLVSAEYRADRQAGRARHGFRSTAGSVGFELSLVDQDDMIEAALGGTWSAVTGTATATVTTSQSGKTYTRATGSFVTDGFLPGDTIVVAGLVNSASNGRKTIAIVSALVITVIEAIGADETSVGSVSVTHTGKRLKVGTTLKTFTFERRFPTITQYQPFTGTAVNQMSLSITPENMVTGSYDLIGMNFGALAGSSLGSPTAVSSNEPFNGFVGAMYENNLAVGLITSLTMQLNNSRSVSAVLFSTGSPDVFEGLAEVTGTARVMFQDAVMLNKFINETDSSMNVRMDGLNGTDFMRIYVPSLLYTGGTINPPTSGPVEIEMPWRANPDTVTGTNLLFQRSNT
jgi:hypothetical protein